MADNSGGMANQSNHFQTWNTDALTVIICSSLSLFSSLELLLTIGLTFRSYRGLYFWSLVIASLGIIPYALGYTFEYFSLFNVALGIALDAIGWSLMVTGQSFVLYSRLHLVFGGGWKKTLRGIVFAISLNGMVLHGTTGVIAFGANLGSVQSRFSWGLAYDIIEPIQMTIFALQEGALSCLYVWRAIEMLKTSDRERSRRIIRQLFLINIIIILLDAALLVNEFGDRHVLQQTLKGVVYSVKLKLEIHILNRLVEISRSNVCASNMDTTEFRNPTTRGGNARGISENIPPQWISDLKKSDLQGIKLSIGMKRHPEASSDPDAIQPVYPNPAYRKHIDETDLLYADAVRTVSVG